jgi:CSLREA domain-containing protein/MYXO-CTERM domain-containing protein
MTKPSSFQTSLTFLAAMVVLPLTAGTARANLITVNTVADELNTDGDCSLREAITSANTDSATDACVVGAGADTVVVPAGTYVLSRAGTGEDANVTGDLDLLGGLTLVGAGRELTTLDAAGVDRVLDIRSGTVTVQDLTVTGGLTAVLGGGGPLSEAEHGGGIRSGATLLLTDVDVLNNVASSADQGGQGGGVFVDFGNSATLTRCTVAGNTAGAFGAGVSTEAGNASLTIIDSTISDNHGGDHGGVSSRGPTLIFNSTIHGNSGSSAGGIAHQGGDVSIDSCTITANVGTQFVGGVLRAGGAGSVTIHNSIVFGNTSTSGSADCKSFGDIISQDFNLFGETAGCTFTGSISSNIIGEDPLLRPLADNGGTTETRDMSDASAAIDRGACVDRNGATLTADQRGFARPTQLCDIGAVEHSDGRVLITSTTLSPGVICSAGGSRIDAGSDTGAGGGIAGNGILEPGEIETSSNICNGVDGTNGTDGTDGTDGVDGTNGVDGKPGAVSKPGTDGIDGVDGKPGADGTDGADGLAGAVGTDGADGKAGKAGSSGSGGCSVQPGPSAQPRNHFLGLLALSLWLVVRRRRNVATTP